jgi:hypothetical protein
MINQRHLAPLIGILIWISGCVAWNVVGVLRVAQTGTGIGPTASLMLAAGLIGAAVVLVAAARGRGLTFAMLSALFALMSFAAVYQAFSGQPSLWPSPFWRWAGAALNMFGLGASAFGVIRGLQSKLRKMKTKESVVRDM